MKGPEPTKTAFEDVVADFGFVAALLLDQDGRVLQVYPAMPALIGTVISDKYPHLREALAGVPATSNVVPSAARALPVVAFAAPYDTAYGRRVLSGAFDVSATPMAAHLRNALPFAGGEVYLLDATGSIMASNLPSTGAVRTLDVIDPTLPRPCRAGTSGVIRLAGPPRHPSPARRFGWWRLCPSRTCMGR